MSTPSLESSADGFKLKGAVTLLTAPLLLGQLPLNNDSTVTLDLSETQGSDSSLVALLVAWVRDARAPIKCENTPEEILSLIDLYGVEALLLQ